MKHKGIAVILVALTLSCIYGFIYIKIFEESKTQSVSSQPIVVYTNQIGVYQNLEKMAETKEKLKDIVDVFYEYKKGDLTYLLTVITTDSLNVEQQKNLLNENGYNVLTKEYEISDPTLIQDINSSQYDTFLQSLAKEDS